MIPSSDKVKRILVTGANGDIAAAIGRVLLLAFPEVRLMGADLGEAWPGQVVFHEMHVLPRADNSGYIAALRELVEETRATCIIPCTEPELEKLADEYDSVDDLPLLMNSPEIVAIGLDKLRTMEWLTSIGVRIPETRLHQHPPRLKTVR